MVGDQRQGWAVFARHGHPVPGRRRRSPTGPRRPAIPPSPRSASTPPSALQAGGNMEGKEVRFGIANSALFATVTTDASCGAVNSMHDSFTPLGGLVPLFNIQLGEIIVGGVGAGLYGMLLFAIIAVFVAGPDGRPHAGVSRQEDRGQGSQDGDARHPDPAAVDPGLHRDRHGGRCRPRRPRQPGPARLQRDPLRLHLGHRQQRLGVRRHQRQHAVLQHDHRASRCSSAAS